MKNDDTPVLIIDDSFNDGEFAEIVLRESGFEVSSVTKLSDAIDILKGSNIKRVVLDLGGLVKNSDNPLAALNALEEEGLEDLQIVVLTGNKNPSLVREIEKRGYQCVLKDAALDLERKSDVLPNAIANLSSSHSHDLRSNVHVNELFARISRIENQLDGLLLSLGNSNLQSLHHELKFVESQVNSLQETKDRVAEIKIDCRSLEEQFAILKSEVKLLNTDKNTELLLLLSKSTWILRINRRLSNICVLISTEINKWFVDNLKLILLGAVATLLTTSPLWNTWINELPRIQNKIRVAIEHLLR
ncbi:MAG: hypothetical protein ACRC2V_03125 [Xenococcaceae cyanobacterium]